jgi:hypothetical protein
MVAVEAKQFYFILCFVAQEIEARMFKWVWEN